MEQFELRFLDRANALVLSRPFVARDDTGAMAAARMESAKHTLEVWHQQRLVGRVERPPTHRAPAR